MYNKVNDIRRGLIKGYGEDAGGKGEAYLRDVEQWAVSPENPVKNIQREIKGSLRTDKYNIDTKVVETIEVPFNKVSEYPDVYVERGASR